MQEGIDIETIRWSFDPYDAVGLKEITCPDVQVVEHLSLVKCFSNSGDVRKTIFMADVKELSRSVPTEEIDYDT